jgi:hypothetical protein
VPSDHEDCYEPNDLDIAIRAGKSLMLGTVAGFLLGGLRMAGPAPFFFGGAFVCWVFGSMIAHQWERP